MKIIMYLLVCTMFSKFEIENQIQFKTKYYVKELITGVITLNYIIYIIFTTVINFIDQHIKI